MSAPHCIHLLRAGSRVTEGHRYGTYIALCQALLSASSLPAALCPDECDREVAAMLVVVVTFTVNAVTLTRSLR